MAYRRADPKVFLPRTAATLVVALVLWSLMGFPSIANPNSRVGWAVGFAIVLVSAFLIVRDRRRNA
jgi:hypothetical protein